MKSGCSLPQIGDLTLPQFLLLANAAEREDAERRRRFVTDIGVTLSGILGGGEAATKHLSLLANIVNEETDNDSPV